MNSSVKAISSSHNDREKTITMVVYALQALSFLFVLIGYLALFANSVWLIYRTVKGWLRLSEGREMSVISNN